MNNSTTITFIGVREHISVGESLRDALRHFTANDNSVTIDPLIKKVLECGLDHYWTGRIEHGKGCVVLIGRRIYMNDPLQGAYPAPESRFSGVFAKPGETLIGPTLDEMNITIAEIREKLLEMGIEESPRLILHALNTENT